MNKLLPIVIAVAVIVGGGAFYGGMKYAESTRQNFTRQNLGGREFGVNIGGAFNQDHEGGFLGRFGSEDGSRPLSGEIISQSEVSFTIKLSDGSTKIVFISDSTQITKSVDGTVDDLSEGEQIFISGDENPDGSYTAKTIQLSPRPIIQ